MKKTLFPVLGSLILLMTCYACTKSKSGAGPEKTPTAWNGETQKISLQFSGDLTVLESPLGQGQARITPDSVLYAVDIRVGNWLPFAQGVVRRLDSIEIPRGIYYKMQVTAIRRGSSPGLWQGDTANLTYFDRPIQRVNNYQITRDTAGLFAVKYDFMDSLSYFSVAVDASNKVRFRNSELDIFYCDYQGYPSDSGLTAINLNMRRLTYGFKFEPINFPGGTLNVDYGGMSAPKSLPVATAAQTENLYTADIHKITAYPFTEEVYLTLSWTRPNGQMVPLGSRWVTPKRNVLTTIKVTNPVQDGTPVKLNITEQTWTKDTVVVW
ncbi:hypothetical protein SAMN05444266_104101 [Chitinophaga jiangningensis]|uniref:Uncharacterized protein n=1 Tax=Chitinophaga jiangningensis TaxID=1419482 RepID=A0A1M7BWF7_9BACT|nr:hypothetical protein [Chitinophaga jiangningensis]SHL59243.1 hypothetical protein SAMN05444266_104101 [Chitinophaga jiangningensis]